MTQAFTDEITIYTGTTFQEDYFVEDWSAAIASIVPGNPTAINTSVPHGLSTGGYCNIREVENTANLDGSFQATVVSPTQFTIALNTTGTTPSGGNVNRPVNLTGWAMTGEIRSSVYTNPGAPNLSASILANSRQALVEGSHSLEEGDEIAIAGSGLTSARILSIYRGKDSDSALINAQRSVLILDQAAAVAVNRAEITRNTKLVATLICQAIAPLAGKFRISLGQGATFAIAPPVPGTDNKYYFDVKYKSGDVVFPILEGRVKVVPMATQVTL